MQLNEEKVEEAAKKSLDEFLNKKILNIKRYLDKIDLEVLDKLKIEWNKYCTAADIKQIKIQLEEYYKIQWLQFRNLTETEQERLEYLENKIEFEKELYNEEIIDGISTNKELEGTGVNREEYENTFSKIEMLEKAVWICKRLKRTEDTLNVKPTVIRCYRLLLLAKKSDELDNIKK